MVGINNNGISFSSSSSSSSSSTTHTTHTNIPTNTIATQKGTGRNGNIMGGIKNCGSSYPPQQVATNTRGGGGGNYIFTDFVSEDNQSDINSDDASTVSSSDDESTISSSQSCKTHTTPTTTIQDSNNIDCSSNDTNNTTPHLCVHSWV